MLGNTLGGRYQLIRHLGGGGFGQTYLAEDLHLPGKPWCVVKQLKPKTTSPEALQVARRLFDTEAQVLYILGDHEQIPRLFAHFEENQEFYLVQEFIEGEVLSQDLKTHKQLSESEVMNLLQDLLTVLEFVHEQQVVHRDVKPSNLIRRKSDRRLILIDFGAVKQVSMQVDRPDRQSTLTLAIGSSGYMPSEQLAGKPRFSSDIYAVGMLGIQCLTGIYPEKLREDPQTSEIIWRDRVQVNPKLADILDTMVRYDYRQRYPSAKEALAALQALTAVSSLTLRHPEPVSSTTASPSVSHSNGHLVWLERGDELFQLQRYKEAISAYDRVIQAQPQDYLAWFKRGITLENLNQFEAAIDAFDHVIQIQPEDYLAWYKRGVACERLQRYPEALQSYERVAELQPENYWAWHDRGKILELLRRFDEAIASYDRAVQLKSDFQLAVESRKRVLSQLQRVDTLYHLQHYDEAVASCDRAIELNPNDSLAWLMRGMALENLQRIEDAVAAYDHVVKIQPDDHLAWFRRANALEKLNRFEEAIAAYYRVVQLQQDNYWAWHDRGKLLEKLHQYEAALASYDRAIQLKSDFQGALEGRGRVLEQMQRRGSEPAPEAAETSISRASTVQTQPSHQPDIADLTTEALFLEQSPPTPSVSTHLLGWTEATIVNHPTLSQETHIYPPSNATTIVYPAVSPATGDETQITTESSRLSGTDDYHQWFKKGRILEKLQRYTEALVAYNRASQIRDDDSDLWCWQGNVLYTLGRYDEAIVSYDRALQLKPESATIWGCQGRSLARLKRYRDAVICFEQAIKLQGSSYNFWYLRGKVLVELKQYSKAVQSFDRAIQLKPDFQPAINERNRAQQHLLATVGEPESSSVSV